MSGRSRLEVARRPQPSTRSSDEHDTADEPRSPLRELQRTVGNRATVGLLDQVHRSATSVQRKGLTGGGRATGGLDAAAVAEFRRLLGAGGKKKSGGLRTPAYRKIKAALTDYAAKKGGKPLGWRKKRVVKLEALVGAWTSNGKHLKDASSSGVAHRQAMEWLKPKLASEKAGLRPLPRSEHADTTESPSDDRSVGVSGSHQVGFTSAKEDDESSDGGQTSRPPGTKPQAPRSSAEDDSDDGFENSPSSFDDDEVDTKAPPTSTEHDHDDDEESSSTTSSTTSSSSSSYDASLPKTRDEAIDYLLPTPQEALMSQDLRNARIEERLDKMRSDKRAKLLLTPEIMDLGPGRGFHGSLLYRDTKYEKEFTQGSVVLKEIIHKALDAPDTDSARKYMLVAGGWTSDVFEKFWDKAVDRFGSHPKYQRLKLVQHDASESSTSESSSKSGTSKSGTSTSGSSRRSSESSISIKSALDDDEVEPEANPLTVTSVGPKERHKYKLNLGATVTQGDSTKPFDTSAMFSKESGAGYGIFVMTTNGVFYAGSHNLGLFHHSSFTAGSSVAAAGEIAVRSGKITALTNKSGHYRPQELHMVQAMRELASGGVDLASVEYTHMWDEGGKTKKQKYGTAKQFRESQER